MQITLTWQSVITISAVLGALVAIVTYFAKVVRWVDNQKKQDEAIQEIRRHHEEDMAVIKEAIANALKTPFEITESKYKEA